MAKYGYKAGEGIGAEGNKGITEALEVAREEESREAKRQRYAAQYRASAAFDDARALPDASLPKANMKAMGKVVNKNIDPKQAEEKAKFGEPSETVLLENMVGLDDVDEDLKDEIREHCTANRARFHPLTHGLLQARSAASMGSFNRSSCTWSLVLVC